MATNTEITHIRDEEIRIALKYFDGKCFCCTRSVKKKKRNKTVYSFTGFQFHHMEYRDGEPRRRDYPKGATGTWRYKRDVLPFVEKYHDEFMLFCTPHHHTVEKIYRIEKHHPDWVNAIMLAVKLTHT